MSEEKKKPYWVLMLDILEQGLKGNTEQVRQYAELLLARCKENNDEALERFVHNILTGTNQGAVLYPEELQSNPLSSLEEKLLACLRHSSSSYRSIWSMKEELGLSESQDEIETTLKGLEKRHLVIELSDLPYRYQVISYGKK